jgi:chemotaxis protein MotB
MRMAGRLVTACGALILVHAAGCASLDDLNQVKMANRKLTEEKEALERDLQDARAVADQLRERVGSLERELQSKSALADSLRAENERLAKAFEEAQKQLSTLAGKEQPKPVVIERALPPALNEALKKFAQKYPDIVEFDEKTGVVKWKADLVFALGSDVVREDAKAALNAFAEIVKGPEAKEFDVIVVGHTCTTPINRPETLKEHKTNWHLSAHRAISVAGVLIADAVPPTRLGVMGYGEFRPVAPNSTEQGKAKNRRVEMYMVPANKIAGVSKNIYEVKELGLAFLRP